MTIRHARFDQLPELRLQKFAKDDARVELPLSDLGSLDVEPLQFRIWLTSQPLDKRLADRGQFDTRDVGEHRPIIDVRVVRRPFPRIRFDLENRDRQRPIAIYQATECIDARRSGADDGDT
jgi:hypothetical protein